MTLIAKGSPVTVQLDNGQSIQEHAIPAEGILRPAWFRRWGREASARSRSRRATSSARRGSKTSWASVRGCGDWTARAVGERDHTGHLPIVDDQSVVHSHGSAPRAPVRASRRR